MQQPTGMSFVVETTGAPKNVEDSRDINNYYRISIYHTTLDQIISEFNRRFSVKSWSLMTAAIVRVAQNHLLFLSQSYGAFD